jgi:pimeloyl-ACP methyl ester carboxylesterase
MPGALARLPSLEPVTVPGMTSTRLSSGAEIRLTGPMTDAVVVCLNGGQGDEVEGTWSASMEWLVRQLAPRFPKLGFAEVRYRVKSWNRLPSCVEDARSAIREAGSRRTLLLGFSMGGTVAIEVADEPTARTVVGLAPFIPEWLSLEPLRGRRLVVFHGTLDCTLPGVRGVRPSSSRLAFQRACDLGIEAEYKRVRGAVHGIAIRGRRGALLPLPRACSWTELVAGELTRFQSGAL